MPVNHNMRATKSYTSYFGLFSGGQQTQTKHYLSCCCPTVSMLKISKHLKTYSFYINFHKNSFALYYYCKRI